MKSLSELPKKDLRYIVKQLGGQPLLTTKDGLLDWLEWVFLDDTERVVKQLEAMYTLDKVRGIL